MSIYPLATIAPDRYLKHRQGRVIFLRWDDKLFRLTRRQFNDFVRALEHGSRYLYAESGCYSIAHVDDETCDLWMGTQCLRLSRSEYRTLLNAALTTETRLHGFRQVEPKPAQLPQYHLPESPRFYWN